jgi:hypothetical protein
MKKLFMFLLAAGLVTAASAQSGYRNNSRSYNNSYSNQYSRTSWNDHRYPSQYERRRLAERRRYEMMMRRRAHYNDRRYYRNPSYGYSGRPSFRLSIGIGGRR